MGAAEHMECVFLTLSVQNSLPLVPLVSPTANPGPPAEEGCRRRTQIGCEKAIPRGLFFSLAVVGTKQPAAAVASLHPAALATSTMTGFSCGAN